MLECSERFRANYKDKSKAVSPETLLVIGNKLGNCSSCGRLNRKLIIKFNTCSKDCKFVAKCTECLYLTKFKSAGICLMRVE